MLDRTRWERIASLYDRAVEQDPGERDVFLSEACSDDHDLRREVESLLAQDVASPGLLEEVANDARQGNPAADHTAYSPEHSLPETIGRYRIIGWIAEGGMGSVYEAEQDNPRRTVALKVIRHGWSRPELMRRFQLETAALGRLEHPNIARIYDAGVADQGFGPQPYFAMERIRGVELSEYAASHHLTIEQKLQLLISLCGAVEHAHQRGIIHRDLKPANILVDAQGQPKILDFGVARLTDADAAVTRRTNLGEIVGTLAYMSPEQISGDPADLDSRSDVYTLGVVMYELLAGRLPYEVGRKVPDAVRAICEGDVFPLGASKRGLSGDLETITGKALEKDKHRRYAAAAELAADLRRFLRNEPIQARSPSLVYQAGKFAARHRSLAITAAAVFVMLIAGLAATSREALRANGAERSALVERDRAFAAERNANSERDRARRAESSEMAQRAQAEGERNRAQAEKARADREAATASAVSDFLRNDLLAQAGARKQAAPNVKPDTNLTVRSALDRAAARVEGRFKEQPEVEAAIRETIGAAYHDLSLFHEAAEQFGKAEALRRVALGPDDPATLETMHLRAEALNMDSHPDQAVALMTQVLDVRRRTLGDGSPLTLASVNDLAAMIVAQRGARSEAERYMNQAMPIVEQILGPDHEQTLVLKSNLASIAIDTGQYQRAEELLVRVVAARRRLLGADHPSTMLAINNLGVAYRFDGKYSESEPLLQEAFRRRQAIYGDSHLDTLASMTSLGLLHSAKNQLDEADALLSRSLELRRKAFGDTHTATLAGLNNLAELREKQGRFAEAEQQFAQLVQARRKSLSPGHPNLLAAIASLGRVRFLEGKFGEAEPLLEEAVSGFAKLESDGWRGGYAECVLGANQAELTKYAEAERHLTTGYAKLSAARETIPFENRVDIDRAREWIAQLYESWGKTAAAGQWRSRP